MTLGLSAEELIARHKEQQKAWRLANPEKIKFYHDKHQNTDEGRARKREWNQQNKERLNERRREQYAIRTSEMTQDTAERLRERRREIYRQKHPIVQPEQPENTPQAVC